MIDSGQRSKSETEKSKNIDWDFIDSFNPDEILSLHQTETIKLFIKRFKQIDIIDNPAKYNNPILPKFLRLCQVACTMLVEGSIRYKKAIEQKDEIIWRMQEMYQSLESSYTKARSLIDVLKGEIHPCPVCNQKFKSSEYLDKHIKKIHPNIDNLWHQIKSSNSSNPQNLLSQQPKDSASIVIDEDSIPKPSFEHIYTIQHQDIVEDGSFMVSPPHDGTKSRFQHEIDGESPTDHHIPLNLSEQATEKEKSNSGQRIKKKIKVLKKKERNSNVEEEDIEKKILNDKKEP